MGGAVPLGCSGAAGAIAVVMGFDLRGENSSFLLVRRALAACVLATLTAGLGEPDGNARIFWAGQIGNWLPIWASGNLLWCILPRFERVDQRRRLLHGQLF